MMLLTWLILLGIFIVLAAVSEDEDYDTRGTVLSVILLAFNAAWFLWWRDSFFGFYKSIDLSYLIYFGVYVVAGLVFSFYKWFRFVRWYVDRNKPSEDASDITRENFALRTESYLVLSKHYGKVTAWIGY